MKLLCIGYDLDPARAGRGGVAIYQDSLARALAAEGCEVTLFLGTRHTLRARPRLRWGWRSGLRMVELLDSPLHHCDPRADPSLHVHEPRVESLTREVLRAVRPDVVHLHDPRLHPAAIIDVALAEGCAVLKTVHNHFDLCPQGERFAEQREPCGDDRGGARCRRCLASLPPLSRRRAAWAGTLAATPAADWLRRGRAALRRALPRAPVPSSSLRNAPEPLAWPASLYLARRRALVSRLSRLHAVHVFSRHLEETLRGVGLSPAKLHRIPPATLPLEGLRQALPRRRLSAPPTFGYLTGGAASKGVHVLLEAFARLPRGTARLRVHGVDDPARWGRAHPDVDFFGPYDPWRDLPRVLAPLDVGVVPSLCAEAFGLAGLEFGAAGLPVIGSAIGGIPDWLEDGVNGLLVPPGDPGALADAMLRFVREPGLWARLHEGTRPPKPLATHAREMLELYRDLRSA
ncbi:MAG: glycosyltransferase [Planctomycetota bacterium]|nr:MAG: glycosyltransferase [Planctomycetota bacterium]